MQLHSNSSSENNIKDITTQVRSLFGDKLTLLLEPALEAFIKHEYTLSEKLFSDFENYVKKEVTLTPAKIYYLKSICLHLYYLAKINIEKGNYYKALDCAFELKVALNQLSTKPDISVYIFSLLKKHKALCNAVIGQSYFLLGKNDIAEKYLLDAIGLFENTQTESYNDYLNSLYYLAKIQYSTNLYLEAKKSIQKCLDRYLQPSTQKNQLLISDIKKLKADIDLKLKKQLSTKTSEGWAIFACEFFELVDKELKKVEEILESNLSAGEINTVVFNDLPKLISMVNVFSYLRGQDNAFANSRPLPLGSYQLELYNLEDELEKRLDKISDRLKILAGSDKIRESLNLYFVRNRKITQ